MNDERRQGARRATDVERPSGRAIVVEQWGDASVLEPTRVALHELEPGEVRVRVRYAGVNYVDVYHRTGLYPKEPPFVPGVEAAGEVEEVGADVEGVAAGDRVAWAMSPSTYAEYATVPAWRLVPVPDEVDLKVATAVILQGMTAHFLVHDTYAVREGDHVLVHAAAGGVGLLLVQMATRRGAKVIGTCSTEEKAELVRAAGAEHVILYTQDDFHESTMSFTEGRGVAAVYDSVGRDTFDRSLSCLARRGMLVLFGQASGPVPPVDPQRLARQGSVYLTRPSLADYTFDAASVRAQAMPVLSLLQGGQLDVRIERVLPLDDAATAHQLLESRKTAGKLLLEV